MKAKILIITVVLVSFLSSCATDCRNKKWRSQRFVEHKAQISHTSKNQADS